MKFGGFNRGGHQGISRVVGWEGLICQCEVNDFDEFSPFSLLHTFLCTYLN